ncbi:MAG TPA: ATP-binding protein [Nocardioides sp.]|nr:ATP-binding protein [Nocardioides sp.]
MWSPFRRGELTLAATVLLLQLAVIATLLVAVGVLSIRQSSADFADESGAQMRSVAEYVAALPQVRGQLTDVRDGTAPPNGTARTLAPYAAQGVNLSDASEVIIVSVDGTVLAASEPSLVGGPVDLGDSDALQGRGWTGDVRLDGRQSVAAHAPIIADDGSLLGIVAAEVTYPSVADQVTGAAPDLVLFLGLGAVLGLAGTWVVSRVVRRSTRGLGTTELANLADQREALLHAIREGVVGVGTDGRVTVMNDAARATLGLEEAPDPVGRPVDALGLDPHVVALLTGEGSADARDALALVGQRVVVFNRGRASTGGRGIGTVTTLRDRTELVSLQSQLSSNLSITDTLRAQTHEFDNRLHTISGLVQLGEYDEVATLVGTLTRHRAEVGEYVAKRIADPAVAALVVAKHAVAEERGVTLELDPGSRLPAVAPDLAADLTTVIGNLVDNAVDASAGGGRVTQPAVELWIHADDEAVHLRVRDNGPGVPADLRDAVFVRGWSTKEEVLGGRGIGLPLVRLVCTQRGGEVVVDDAEAGGGGGAEFRVVLPFEDAVRQDGRP